MSLEFKEKSRTLPVTLTSENSVTILSLDGTISKTVLPPLRVYENYYVLRMTQMTFIQRRNPSNTIPIYRFAH
jgi:hypothetical protein